MALTRRVTARQVAKALCLKPSWFGELQRRGVLPRGHTDPGGRRRWFTEAEVNQIISKWATRGDPPPQPSPQQRAALKRAMQDPELAAVLAIPADRE